MAQPAFLTDQSILSDSPELMDLARKRKMADLLMSQEQPTGQMISGRYVKPSWAQQLAPLVGVAVGKNLNKQLDEQQQKYVEALRKLGAKETLDILDAAQGKPESQEELAGPAYQGVAPSIQYPAVEANPQLALARALNAQSPQAKALVAPLMQNALPKKTDKLIEYDTYKKEGGKLPFSEWVNRITPEQEARLAIDRQRLGLEGARLGLEQQKLAAELSGGKLNNEQGQAVGFGTRAKEANAILTNLENKGVAIPGKTSTVVSGIAGMTPFVGDKYSQATKSLFNVLPEFAGGLSPEQQQNASARKNFATAVLRKESGASISPTEFADVDKIYFPQIGDSKETIKQKQRARDLAIHSLTVQAGPGAKLIQEFQPQTEFSSSTMSAVNPTTGQRIVSQDGGKTWQPAR